MKLEVLISGENINLCKPNEKFALESDWFDWFNDPRNTRFLDQGVKVNTRQDQKNFFLSIKNRLVLIIQEINNNNYVGVISLSNINLDKKTCELAIVRDLKKNKLSTPLASLESVALITEYAFEKMNIRIISAGQHIGLKKWQNQMELVGYKVEGLHELRFFKNDEETDTVSIACNYKDYIILKQRRNKLWDGNEKMYKRYKKMIKIKQFSKKLAEIYNSEKKEYYDKIFNL
jgi:RimJ/RimL family protein N-acetyltransferase